MSNSQWILLVFLVVVVVVITWNVSLLVIKHQVATSQATFAQSKTWNSGFPTVGFFYSILLIVIGVILFLAIPSWGGKIGGTVLIVLALLVLYWSPYLSIQNTTITRQPYPFALLHLPFFKQSLSLSQGTNVIITGTPNGYYDKGLLVLNIQIINAGNKISVSTALLGKYKFELLPDIFSSLSIPVQIISPTYITK
jgi:hypothetical protein